MAHKVILGGFGSSEPQMKRIAAELSDHYDDEFFGMSFRRANDDLNFLAKVMKGAEAYTHSAGFLAIRHTQPETIHGLASPLEAKSRALVGRAALCGYDATVGSFVHPSLWRKMAKCGRELAAEVSLHAHANLGRIATIAAFDAIEAGLAAQEAGIRVGLGFMENDRLFIPSALDAQKAEGAKMPLVTLEGGHVDFLVRPVEMVDEYRGKYEKMAKSYELAA